MGERGKNDSPVGVGSRYGTVSSRGGSGRACYKVNLLES